MHQMMLFSLLFYSLSAILFPLGLYFGVTDKIYVLEWVIMLLGSVPVEFTAVLDSIAFLFSSSVFFISGNVCWFAVGYMHGEPYMKRFMYLVFFFVVSMNILIYSGNLITVLLGWDGLGLTSFLLVIYYQNSYSLGAGLITVLTNRLGDVGLILAIGLLLSEGHWTISEVKLSSFIGALVVLGAVTKSAQYPFSSWLPMAMAAPTPVSALVHSSTLVTAGVYLLIRFYPVMEEFDGIRSILLLMSSLTMVLAGFAAFTEMDFKKIIAYSTLSQLGVMMVALGLGSPFLSFFHLLSHAMFKALMFICAGTYIYYHKHGQDLRSMGNLSVYLPVTQVGLVVSNLALCGFPFLSGFYSKDPVYEMSITGGYNLVAVFFMVLGLFLTSVYSVRSMLLSQFGVSNQVSLNCFTNGPSFFKVPVFLLGFLAVTWGSSLNWLLVPPMALGPISFWFGVLPIMLFIFAVLGYYYWCVDIGCYSSVGMSEYSTLQTIHEGFIGLWFLSFISSQYVVKEAVHYGGRFISVVDCGWVEASSGQGSVSLTSASSSSILSLNANLIPVVMMVGFLSFLGFFGA